MNENEVKKSGTKLRKSRRRLTEAQRLAVQLFGFVLVIYILFASIVGIMTMPNRDMYPRIDGGDILLFYRLDKEPKSQDIITFKMNETRYVARVIAVAGDTVEITNEGAVIVNGNNLVESNVFYETYPLVGYTKYPITLGANECFVLADSRRGAEDSRYFGPVNYNNILGTVITVMRRNNL